MDKLVYDSKKISVVNIDSVRPNSWNPKVKEAEEYKQVLESIKENGLRETIKVRENPGDDSKFDLYEILDGEQRWTACKELGYTKVIIYNEGVVSDKKAREDTLWWQTQVPVDEIQLSELLADLVKNYTDVKVPYTEEQMQNYLKLADFDWDAYNSEKPPDDTDNGGSETIKVTGDQYAVISDAIEKVKADSDEKKISDGRALELICADFLGGPTSSLVDAITEAEDFDPHPSEQAESSEEYQH